MSEEGEVSEAAMRPREELPEGCVVRLEIYDEGVRVSLSEGMTGKEFAEMLRAIADAFESGPIKRVE